MQKNISSRKGGRRKIGRSSRTTMGKSTMPRTKDTLLSMQEANALRFYGAATKVVSASRKGI